MKPIAVVDLETDPFKRGRSPKPFLAGWFDGKRTRSFWGPNCLTECWQSIRKELVGYIIYWHDAGKFETRYFLPLIHAAGGQPFNIKRKPAKFTLPDKTEFRDSFRILPVSLKATGQKKEIDYRLFEANKRNAHREEITQYWKQDLQVTFDHVTAFIEEYGFGLTLAGRSFAYLKKHFDMDPPHADEHYDELFRSFYYGGRVQFFELGPIKGGPFTLIDINSAYPAAMLKKHAFGLEFDVTETLPKNEKVLQTCFIRFKGQSDGGLPFRHADGSLHFEAHSGEFFVTGWEFVACRKARVVQVDEIISCHVPRELKDFGRFVRFFYERKAQAEKGSSEELFAKLVLNSLYGRFALNPRDFCDVKMTDLGDEPEDNEQYREQIRKLVKERHPGIRGKSYAEKCADYWAGFDGKWELANQFEDVGISIWERRTELRRSAFFNVATSASITGCVRAFLFESLRKCKRPVYTDTDSILAMDVSALHLSPKLGEWKREAESVRDGLWIAGRKLYACRLHKNYWRKCKYRDHARRWHKYGAEGRKWKIAAKGVNLTAAQIVRVAKGELIESSFEAPTFSLLTSRSVKGSPDDFLVRKVRRDDKRKKNKPT